MRNNILGASVFQVIYLLCWHHASAQKNDSTAVFKISAYVDAYYARYSDSVGSGSYQKFPAISPRSNSAGINIAQLSAHYESEKVRATATLHYGDLPAAAWSPVFNYIQEANAGIRLTKKIWVDAGFFKTHIGTEALLPKDNITSSVSTITFFEPWWQSGIRISYDVSSKFQTALYLINGYNQFVATNKKKGAGLVLNYSPNAKCTISYLNLLSDNTPDSISTPHLRFLNNFVLNYQWSEKIKMVVGADIITQQNSDLADQTAMAFVYSGIVTLNYKFNPKTGIYVRGELFNDNSGFLSGTYTDINGNVKGLIIEGVTGGFEFKPTENSYMRLEGRELLADPNEYIFYTDGQLTNKRLELMANIGVWF